MKKTFIAAMMLACFSLSANANTMGPVDPEFEAEVMQLVFDGVITADEGAAMIEAAMSGNYGIATCAIANPNNKKKGGIGNGGVWIPEEEVPLSLTPSTGTTSKSKNKNKNK